MTARRRLLLASQPLGEGVPNHVLDLVRGLEGAPFALDVACPRASTLWRALEGDPNVRLHAIAAARRPAPADARSLATLARLAARCDVVHAHSSKVGFLARLAGALRGRSGRCIFTPHGWSFWAVDGLERALYLGLERMAARWCRAIVALSRFERDAGLRAGVGSEALYRVIPNGIDLARFAADPAPATGRVVMVGRLAAPKRQDVVVRAFAALRSRAPEAELQLVGDGPRRSELQTLARQLGLERSVHFLGSRDDVPRLLADAAVVVLASDYEAMPLSIVEAMAAGVPVVATRAGGLEEVIADGETGRLVPGGDANALAEAVAALLVEPERARAMGERGRQVARARFSRERMVSDLLALYEEAARSA